MRVKFERHLAVGSTSLVFPVLLLLSFILASSAYAAQGGNGNGGNGGPSNGDLYGDAVYLYRDVNGVPIVLNDCIRPLGADGRILALNADYDADIGDVISPEAIDDSHYDAVCDDSVLALRSSATRKITGQKIVPLADDGDDDELEACDPIKNCTDWMVEVDLGRLSLLKSPDRVLDRQQAEAVKNLTSGGPITLDEGGRFVVGGSTFDSPLINLALYREYHLWGELRDPETGVVIFNPDVWAADNGYEFYDFLTAAAFAIGAGDDKEGAGVDSEVATRAAGILALAEGTLVMDTWPFHYQGNNLEFLNYSTFTYLRSDIYTGNICFDYFDEDEGDYVRDSMSVIEAVFGLGDLDNGVIFENLEGFARAANDARLVMLFTHDNLVQFVDGVFQTTEITEDNCPPLN